MEINRFYQCTDDEIANFNNHNQIFFIEKGDIFFLISYETFKSEIVLTALNKQGVMTFKYDKNFIQTRWVRKLSDRFKIIC